VKKSRAGGIVWTGELPGTNEIGSDDHLMKVQ
jgi:hypothetical protein